MKNVLYIFGQLSDADVDWLGHTGRRRSVASGEALIRRGVPIESIYVVLEGHFVVSRAADRALAAIGPGEILGEMSFVDASPPAADVAATSPAVVLEVPRDQLQQRLDRDPVFALRFYKALCMMLADRLRDTSAGYLRVPGVLDQDELDPNVLDGIDRAGERFDRMIRQLQGN